METGLLFPPWSRSWTCFCGRRPLSVVGWTFLCVSVDAGWPQSSERRLLQLTVAASTQLDRFRPAAASEGPASRKSCCKGSARGLPQNDIMRCGEGDLSKEEGIMVVCVCNRDKSTISSVTLHQRFEVVSAASNPPMRWKERILGDLASKTWCKREESLRCGWAGKQKRWAKGLFKSGIVYIKLLVCRDASVRWISFSPDTDLVKQTGISHDLTDPR